MTNFTPNGSALPDLIDRILDKGLVINADIKIDLAGTEILGIAIRAAIASFETAAKFGLAFPSGTNLNAPAWKMLGYEGSCPKCGNVLFTKSEHVCSCGWKKTAI
ncbi:MAG: gas vesicle protein, partial [Nanoarchaeota archaeon]